MRTTEGEEGGGKIRWALVCTRGVSQRMGPHCYGVVRRRGPWRTWVSHILTRSLLNFSIRTRDVIPSAISSDKFGD